MIRKNTLYTHFGRKKDIFYGQVKVGQGGRGASHLSGPGPCHKPGLNISQNDIINRSAAVKFNQASVSVKINQQLYTIATICEEIKHLKYMTLLVPGSERGRLWGVGVTRGSF